MSTDTKLEEKGKQDQYFKIEMLLREAEIFKSDIIFMSTRNSTGSLEDSLFNWLSGSGKDYSGKISMLSKVDKKSLLDSMISTENRASISSKIKLRSVDEIILIGDDLSIIMVDDKPVIVRDSRHAAYVAKIMNHSIKIGSLEKLLNLN